MASTEAATARDFNFMSVSNVMIFATVLSIGAAVVLFWPHSAQARE
jgi:hypothetical protein